MISNVFAPEKPLMFICKKCDYNTSNKKDYSRHLQTKKHLSINHHVVSNKITQKTHYECRCGKIYKDNSGLWRHNKRCTKNICKEIEEIKETNEIVDLFDKNLILTLIQQNNELQKQMIEVCKNGTINNTTNNMNNSNNKTFNLQVFLNETCKDAMNIMDFVDSIKISLSDIESIGELGFVNGMSKLIIKNLNALDENMRPVHCNDLKRSSLFVKDANVWAKEDDNNNKLKKAIKSIAHKNICALPEWRKKYPDCIYSESKKSDQYNHIVIEAMGGSGDNDDEKADKIISKIAKTITIDKNNK
jgi:hypothetical protein